MAHQQEGSASREPQPHQAAGKHRATPTHRNPQQIHNIPTAHPTKNTTQTNIPNILSTRP